MGKSHSYGQVRQGWDSVWIWSEGQSSADRKRTFHWRFATDRSKVMTISLRGNTVNGQLHGSDPKLNESGLFIINREVQHVLRSTFSHATSVYRAFTFEISQYNPVTRSWFIRIRCQKSLQEEECMVRNCAILTQNWFWLTGRNSWSSAWAMQPQLPPQIVHRDQPSEVFHSRVRHKSCWHQNSSSTTRIHSARAP